MRVLVVVFMLVVPMVARAEETPRARPPLAQLDEYTSTASNAASGGDCATVRDLAATVKALDENYYVTVFASDPAIVACVPVLTRHTTAVLARLPMESGPHGKPPLEGGRMIGQILLGGLGQVVGGGVGVLLGIATGSIGGVVLFSAIGSTSLLAAGVYAAGNTSQRSGSLGWTYVGTLGGLAITALPALAIAKNHGEAGLGMVVAGSMIGALIGNTATRRWREGSSMGGIGSLIQVDRGKPSFGVPIVTHAELRGVATTHVPLLGGSF